MPKRKPTSTETTQISERSLPANINAEAALLSAIMIDKNIVPKAIEKLREEHFSRTAHKMIFKAMQEMFYENIEIDGVTLIDRLDRNGHLDKVGGVPYVNQVSKVVVSSANFDYHYNIVLEQALLRQLIVACNCIIESCYESDQPAKLIVDTAEQAIFSIAEIPQGQGFVKVGEIAPDILKSVELVAETKVASLGIGSGFPDLDKLTGGFRPGQFIVMAARPGMGKTSLALKIASHAAVDLNKKVGVFTMEMSSDELMLRLFSQDAEVDMDAMLKGYGLNEEVITRLSQVAEVYGNKHIYIDDAGTNTPLEIRAKCRRLASQLGGLDLIVIDYMQLMNANKGRDSRQQEISEISRALKILAKDMKMPVVALSQLNRLLEQRDNKRPVLSDLRESGAIEQDADLVMFIYREEYYLRQMLGKAIKAKKGEGDTEQKLRQKLEENRGKAELIIGKNRHGPAGTIHLQFDENHTLFRSIDERHEL